MRSAHIVVPDMPLFLYNYVLEFMSCAVVPITLCMMFCIMFEAAKLL